jgi:hypothetical protein
MKSESAAESDRWWQVQGPENVHVASGEKKVIRRPEGTYVYSGERFLMWGDIFLEIGRRIFK